MREGYTVKNSQSVADHENALTEETRERVGFVHLGGQTLSYSVEVETSRPASILAVVRHREPAAHHFGPEFLIFVLLEAPGFLDFVLLELLLDLTLQILNIDLFGGKCLLACLERLGVEILMH